MPSLEELLQSLESPFNSSESDTRPAVLQGAFINPLSHERVEWIPNGAISFDESGRIRFVGKQSDLPEEYSTFRTHRVNGLIVPGFVDAHVHLPQFDCRGKFGKSLIEWLDEFIFPEEMRFADESIARDTAKRFFQAMLHSGTTTAAVYSSVHKRATEIAFEEAMHSRLRIILGKVQMDQNVPDEFREDPTVSLRETEELIERWHRKTDRLWYAVTPRFAPACSMELMKGCAQLAGKYDTFIQTHLNESHEEIQLVKQVFPHEPTYTGVYRHAGLLGSRTLLAHNIHPTDDELALCESTHSAVVHCPDSNLFLGSGRFPLERYDGRNIRLALGSDVGAGTTLSMLHMMRAMSYAQGRSLHPFLPLYSATLGGAKALSLDNEVGNFAPGKQADFVVLANEDHYCKGKSLAELKTIEAASAVVYRMQHEDIREVWVAGERLFAR